MKVLLIGNGGREHALAWKLAESARVSELFVAPGNAGTAQVAENVPIDPLKFKEVEKFIKKAGVQFVVIGPEDPLAAGLAKGKGVTVCFRPQDALEAVDQFMRKRVHG